ncbi:uncharacterized protein LOC143266062 isoform X2 [Megachile rotundata]|uniref:uncharacterized protein LOC143266062 isoform X2 n=1 Tax=Megachile rotundata TaxID=143995 RepID=UPI003FD697CC
MNPKACFALFALGLALASAIPAKIERKSVYDEPAKDLKVEELGDDKERAKKSTLCMEIKDKGAHTLGPVQTMNLVPQNGQVQTFSVPSGQQAAQTFSIGGQQAAQTVSIGEGSGVQTYNIPSGQHGVHTFNIAAGQQPLQAYSIPSAQQPVQTLSVIQTQSQPAPPSAVVIPQPVHPIHTLQIIQPPQAYQQPNINIVQPAVTHVKEVEIEEKPEPTPAPVPHTTQAPKKPERIVMPSVHHMDMNVYPVTSVCKEQMVVVPKPVVAVPEYENVATMVKVPHCHHSHHALLTQCDCKPSAMAVEPMHLMALQRSKMMGMHTLVPRQADNKKKE